MGVEIKKWLRCDNDEVNTYLQELESELTSFEAKNIKKLIIACDEMAGEIANDMVNILRGNDKLTILSDDKNDVLLDRLLKIISSIKNFREVSEAAQSLIPKEIDEETAKQITTEDKPNLKKLNAYERKVIGRKA